MAFNIKYITNFTGCGMKKAAGLLFIISFLFPHLIFAQPTVIPMLRLNPNPQSFGLGMSGVSNTTNYPLGFYYNPAILGFSAQTNNLSYQFFTDKIKWAGYDYNTSDNKGITLGYNFNKQLNGLNLSAGVGYISSTYKYQVNYALDNPSLLTGPVDSYKAYGIGISLDYYVTLAFGLTFKNIESKLYYPYSWESGPRYEAKVNAIDWGILLNVPISKLAFRDFNYKPSESLSLRPVLNFSLGYSRSNIGDEIYYVDPSQKEALPLTAKLGYTLSLGTDLLFHNQSINFFTYDITIEAEDLLVNFDNMYRPVYQGLLGDIKTWDNLIEWKRTDNITLRKAQRLSLFETVSLLYGSYYSTENYTGNYETLNRTNGFVVSTNGLFKLLSRSFNGNPFPKFFFDHFEIEYVNASLINEYSQIPNFNFQEQTDIKAISVLFKNFTF
jgi:hypothetical protein